MNRPPTFLTLGAALLLGAGHALAVDHDNIDSGRPLDFDDAETIAFREKAFEFGAALSKSKGGRTGVGGDAEFLLGFAKNWQLGLGLDPEFASEDGGRRRFNIGDWNPGVIVGYSVPPGFPTRFDRTLVSQIGFRAAPDRGESGIVNVGLGLRQQVTPRSVFDVGVKSYLSGGGDSRERFRLIAGYSTAF